MDFKQHMLSLPDKNLLHFIFIFKSGKKNIAGALADSPVVN